MERILGLEMAGTASCMLTWQSADYSDPAVDTLLCMADTNDQFSSN